ncbi:1-acyl-sn-glycerol-3-phosphate acyltransferase [Allosaccharopolyspora coralli]|uniref:1-acyl-sn-glycerol-3-phosphate acyltransferase n=1 Tax=Allosaccharopolyspora coralli TaxID=2665642 RepID=A0A5Q3QCF9_9PSEU|nr:lysophospholipid acyltransferase family protein [Allosaccharopolyspora coralli]QGK70924.1 1-acyl-sn-glycerol-3-phosphate acyltransferase [Allosaccharopolyspora coralli]
MVALPSPSDEPTRRIDRRKVYRETPWLWRAVLRADRAVVALTGRLEVTGDVPDELRERPLLLAANHIGNVDALVLMGACHHRRLAPRFVATGGLFRAAVLGTVMRRSHHIRTDRGSAGAREVLSHVVSGFAANGRPVLVYPEGGISTEPGLWPERGKTGVARMALASGAPVVPISQWGAHEAMRYGFPAVKRIRDLWIPLASWLRATVRRPRLRVHFGAPVDLSGLSIDRAGDARRAHERIMRAITDGLVPLREDELDAPSHRDPTRVSSGKPSPWRTQRAAPND